MSLGGIIATFAMHRINSGKDQQIAMMAEMLQPQFIGSRFVIDQYGLMWMLHDGVCEQIY